MYKPSTIRAFSIVAIIASLLGLVLSGVLMTHVGGTFFMGVLSWAILLWASIIGFQLSRYQLYEDDYRKVGLRIYLILAAFGIFLYVGVIIGLFISVALLATLWGLKKNYDEWNNKPAG